MNKKRRVFPKFKPGMIFTVANYDAFGVVAWVDTYNGPLTYFFLDKSRIGNAGCTCAENAVLICSHGIAGFPDDGWQVVGHLDGFQEIEWPCPTFVTIPWDVSPRKGPATLVSVMDEELSRIETKPLSNPNSLGFSCDDSCSGHILVKNDLRKIVLAGDINAGRSYTVPNPKPDGGPDFQEYCRQHRAEWAALPDPIEEFGKWLKEEGLDEDLSKP